MTDRGVVWACIAIAFVAAIVLFLSGRPVAPEPVFMRPVPVEGITARRMQDTTFARRFALLPTISPEAGKWWEPVPAEVARSTPPPARIMRRAALVNGICARHGMRKVTYGKRWRCRR